MLFLLIAMKISYVLDANLPAIPEPNEKSTSEEVQRLEEQCEKRAEDELMSRIYYEHSLRSLGRVISSNFITKRDMESLGVQIQLGKARHR